MPNVEEVLGEENWKEVEEMFVKLCLAEDILRNC
jgi:hypothetical protein